MSRYDDDLRPYMIHAEKVAEAEEGKTRVASTVMTFKREMALGMLGIYRQIAYNREMRDRIPDVIYDSAVEKLPYVDAGMLDNLREMLNRSYAMTLELQLKVAQAEEQLRKSNVDPI